MESEARRRSAGPSFAPVLRFTLPSKGMPKRMIRASGREARQAMKRGLAGSNYERSSSDSSVTAANAQPVRST